MGRRRDMGRGMGMAGGMTPAANPGVGVPPVSPADDLDPLKAQASAMEESLKAVNERIARLLR